ncbi:hypothetical protein MEO94_27480, partial [Dolichospermum sp. ST_sed9]|nr:hypothetical protein [Dolichospermum sp. ST_sed9]
IYENQQKMDSEEFFHQYNQGKLSDDTLFIEWANDYRHYLGLHQELEQRLNSDNRFSYENHDLQIQQIN